MKKFILLVSLLVLAPVANATLTNSFQFNGKGNWSIDSVGAPTSDVSELRAQVPTGSTVVKAFLYQSTYRNTTAHDVTFGGTVLSGTDWTNLGTATSSRLTAFRTDVTAQVASAVGGGGASPFTFSVVESSAYQDGTGLVVIYSNAAEKNRTIAILDGNTNPFGDTTSINLADPLTAAQLADPGFEASMSLGIGFGYQPSSQGSTVDVNGTRISSCAGGQDDGYAANGGLITMGDTFGDDFTTNPADAYCSTSNPATTDDEAYNLASILNAGDSTIQIDTRNASDDDNIFFAGINLTAVAGVNQPPPTGDVPEPTSLVLLGLGLLGLGFRPKKAA